MKHDHAYALTPAIIVGLSWISITAWICVTQDNRSYQNNLVFVGFTRASATFFNGCMVPFITNVIRDHKCVEWTDMPTSIMLTILYKLFNGMQDISNVLFITSLDMRVYAVLISCDIIVSTISTIRYVLAKHTDETTLT